MPVSCNAMLARLLFCFQGVAAASARRLALSSCRLVGSPFQAFAVILQSEGDEDPAAVCVVGQVDVEPVTENS